MAMKRDSYSVGNRVVVRYLGTRTEPKEATITERFTTPHGVCYAFDDGHWCYHDDIEGLVAPAYDAHSFEEVSKKIAELYNAEKRESTRLREMCKTFREALQVIVADAPLSFDHGLDDGPCTKVTEYIRGVYNQRFVAGNIARSALGRGK